MTISILTRTVFGNKKKVMGTYDANGSSNGTIDLGIRNIEVASISNSENTSEGAQIVKNASDTTEGSAAGNIYIAVADSTDSTGYWEVTGV